MQQPFVISISGIAGSGKTTIVRELNKIIPNSIVISFDSYDDMLKKDYFEWSDRGAHYNEWNLYPMIVDLKTAICDNPEYIILDYPFGYGNDDMAEFIDLAVYIDTPLDIAFARHIIRDYTERSPERHKIDNLLSHLDSETKRYLNGGRNTYTRHIETVKPFCDLIVDGTLKPDVCAKNIILAIQNNF